MPYTILYVEDEPAIIHLVKDILKHPDIRLIAASSADEGVAAARAHKPALLILDLLMPERDGWSAYEEIRADPELGKTPIIILTAVTRRYRIAQEFAASPIDAYITKPFEAGVLRREVEKMLGVSIWNPPSSASKPRDEVHPKG